MHDLTSTSSVPSSQVAGIRWVNKIKTGGTFKSRLVVQKCSPVPSIAYGGTIVPVCTMQSIRMILLIAAELGYEICIMDVQLVFITADVGTQ